MEKSRKYSVSVYTSELASDMAVCNITRAGLRGGLAGQVPGSKDINGIIGNMVTVSRGFHPRKNLSDYHPQFGHASPKTFASTVLGRNKFKNLGFKGRPQISGWAWSQN